ncbi:E3 ubiquitin-protein ligase SIS3 [Arachis duranensis]|uniref:E3 ubiquitin-protein ligase SIS3 n=1 Tax=Arachis duranensis TaxID=130453 RepID=A0A6P4DL64_ARADU|nr:E3 ubiquitin-protein ligase SIS3 [Arachis duranensis]XP_057761815.1 E3 ubiquitin-protein ligase SIS3 [Arachis stenosperma]
MAVRGVNFQWYDGFFLSMLATSVVVVAISWKRYQSCSYPLHLWIMIDYTAVFTFRLLMFVDNGLASGMGLDFGWQQRYARFCGRVVVLSILALLLYPFLWVWTIIGSLWFISSKTCLNGDGKKYGFLIWLLFSYCGLICIACMSMGKWLTRRQAHLLRAQQGIPISEYGVLVEMIRVPDWAFEAAGQESRGMNQDAAAYHPGLYLTPAQREAVKALIQELPRFSLKAVPTDCSECLICLEEFREGNEVRGLPCAHNFHVECIDEWLQLNVKCPQCRCSVFPNLDLSALSNIRSEYQQSSESSVGTSTRYVQLQPSSQSYLLRLQGLVHPVHAEITGPNGETDNALENAENGVVPGTTRNVSNL